MSITRHMSEMIENPFGLSAAGQQCFHCGGFLQDPAVMWSGNDGQTIYLHGPCVLDWMPRLLRDALELKYAEHPCKSEGARGVR
jgi:hypothetical protein